MESRQFVEDIRQPLAFLFPVEVHAPKGIVQGFRTHRHFRRQSLFRQVLHRTAHLEVSGEIVFPVHAEHRLSHLSVIGVTLQRHVHRSSGVDDALVQDGHLSGIVVHRVVSTFRQRLSSGGHHHRTLRHIVGSQ